MFGSIVPPIDEDELQTNISFWGLLWEVCLSHGHHEMDFMGTIRKKFWSFFESLIQTLGWQVEGDGQGWKNDWALMLMSPLTNFNIFHYIFVHIFCQWITEVDQIKLFHICMTRDFDEINYFIMRLKCHNWKRGSRWEWSGSRVDCTWVEGKTAGPSTQQN